MPGQPLNSRRWAILLCGHGSSCPQAGIQTDRFRRRLEERLRPIQVHRAYLESGEPTIDAALAAIAREGRRASREEQRTIIAAPLMLFAGRHVTHDIPDILRKFSDEGTRVVMTSDIGGQPILIQAAMERIGQSVGINPDPSPPRIADSLLLIVGRGHRDPRINRTVENLGRDLARRLGMRQSRACFAGTAHPDTGEGLRRVEEEGWRDVVVFPYLLFDGVLARRVADAARDAAGRTSMRIALAPYIGVHRLAVEAMARVIETTIEDLGARVNAGSG